MAIHEECGIFGIHGSKYSASDVYYGLFSLQHRGQESCGIATNDDASIECVKGMGLVSDVLSSDKISNLKGDIAIGHVRYSTAGGSVPENAQPIVTQYSKGTLSIAHNGNLTNANELKRELEDRGAIFHTTTDSEVIAYLIAQKRSSNPSVEEAVKEVMGIIKGGYALLVMSPRKLIAARDPFGLKPLVMGKLDDAVIFCSETCALEAVGARFIRDIEPGEIVIVENGEVRSVDSGLKRPMKKCVFEYIYFARPDSVIDGISVAAARREAGRILARKHPCECDIVIGVPESGIDAALGFAAESGITYEKGFVKNSYVGRTFIKPSQEQRKQAVKIKLNPISAVVNGKRVVIIDDSIVRGNTIANQVNMLRNAGATEVHVRISSPPFMHPCYYGTDVPDEDYLIACQHTIPEICEIIGADSLGYLEPKDLDDMLGGDGFRYCDACFTGDYPER
ncbi:MAG: amidophosphoribosyltransferase [Clostridiales bacterium]|nr:amidophosphoribosyltransferase [Clostridiales bacterium]MBQ1744222.1 amidophosphoribosyltransferase [Clostridiales bacterium]MBQ2155521.1 amidophosphoribosyltransferase [Clostridiales bacterium]MBQ5518803.1 amidophosphoribosyltransferase [Clostridiales bacterium]